MVKNLPAEAGDGGAVGLIPGSGRSPGEGNGNPLHILAQRTRGARGIWSTRWQRVDHGLAAERAQSVLLLARPY